MGGLELAMSRPGLGYATLRPSGWGVGEFQTVTGAASEATFRRPFLAIRPPADESGTFPWIKSELVASLL
jgi:hypothetical protein